MWPDVQGLDCPGLEMKSAMKSAWHGLVLPLDGLGDLGVHATRYGTASPASGDVGSSSAAGHQSPLNPAAGIGAFDWASSSLWSAEISSSESNCPAATLCTSWACSSWISLSCCNSNLYSAFAELTRCSSRPAAHESACIAASRCLFSSRARARFDLKVDTTLTLNSTGQKAEGSERGEVLCIGARGVSRV